MDRIERLASVSLLYFSIMPTKGDEIVVNKDAISVKV
jgi:hypothetical protein